MPRKCGRRWHRWIRLPPSQPKRRRPPRHGLGPMYRRTFVGREDETRQLHRAFDAAMSGQGWLVMVAASRDWQDTLCEQLATYV